MTTLREPPYLGPKGAQLWADVTEAHIMQAPELVILEEACRIADRLDKLDRMLSDDPADWLHFRANDDATDVRVTVDGVLAEARQQANIFKQLVAALRLPDVASGARPQHRGGARGAYVKATPGKVSSLDRARAARGA